jgi:hypothetical protein
MCLCPVPEPGLIRRADPRVGRGKDGDHLAQLVRIVADGVTGSRLDDHRVAGLGGLWPAIDDDSAFAGGDQQDLFDLVGVFGDRFTVGKGVDENGYSIRAVGPVDKALQRREPGPAHKNWAIVAAHD